MKYFNYLSSQLEESLFYLRPTPFNLKSDKNILAYALGATLYMPATRKNIAEEIINHKHQGLISMVICLEDAIGNNELDEAEGNLIKQIHILAEAVLEGKLPEDEIPLIFIRIRSADQMIYLAERMGGAISFLTGFVFPKFSPRNGWNYFKQLYNLNFSMQSPLYGMPILETSDIIYRESRIDSLNTIKQILDHYYELVLNIRIGATDFSSIFGIRRGSDTTIYDIAVIRDCIADIVNVFLRANQEYVISGPVWEYFSRTERVLKPQLRVSPFATELGREGVSKRAKILDQYIDGLLREVILDKANGLNGKTIIHPTHIKPVQALNVVSHEEYIDALSIIQKNTGDLGVVKSEYANKMNEIRPHMNWARRVVLKSKVYGVFKDEHNFTSLL